MLPKNRTTEAAFTLIELLVVITIIIVLLALLAPALDKAIEQAEMAKCGTNLRSIGSASITYATSNRRVYPKRFNYQWDALMFRHPQHPFDLRPMFQDYVGLDAFVDPLLDETKLDDGNNSPETVIYSNYSVYTGWGVPGFSPWIGWGSGSVSSRAAAMETL